MSLKPIFTMTIALPIAAVAIIHLTARLHAGTPQEFEIAQAKAQAVAIASARPDVIAMRLRLHTTKDTAEAKRLAYALLIIAKAAEAEAVAEVRRRNAERLEVSRQKWADHLLEMERLSQYARQIRAPQN